MLSHKYTCLCMQPHTYYLVATESLSFSMFAHTYTLCMALSSYSVFAATRNHLVSKKNTPLS